MGTGKRNRGNRYSLSVIMSARYAIVYTGGSHRAVEGPGPTTPCSRHQRLPLREADPYSSLSEQTPSEALVSAPYQPKKLPLDIYGAADFRLCGAGVWAVTGRGRAVCLHVWNSRSVVTVSQRAAPRSQTWIAKFMDCEIHGLRILAHGPLCSPTPSTNRRSIHRACISSAVASRRYFRMTAIACIFPGER